MSNEQQPQALCEATHRINGAVPTVETVATGPIKCDCGRVVFYSESCGCPGNPKLELRSKPNE